MTDRLVSLDSLKAELAEALPIEEAAQRLCGVELIDAGHQLKGLCPLHEEDTPSFYVNPGKQVYHCFGCKEGGDAIDLVRKARHLSFQEALHVMAAEAGVDIARYERPLTDEEKARQRLRDECEQWLGSLTEVPERADHEAAEALGVRVSRREGIAGLPAYLTRGAVFPYRTASGRLAGWKVRSLSDKKMFGTPRDFPLQEPALFGLQLARQHMERGELVLVEGEYDCVACHAAGFRNVAALGGSSLTDEHLGVIRALHVRTVTLALDGDQAGREASLSAARLLWRSSDPVFRIAHLPDGQDPEDVLAADPVDFLLALGSARSALEHMLWSEWTRQPRTTLSDKLAFASWVRAQLEGLGAMEQRMVASEVARWIGVPEAEVLDFARTEHPLQAADSERVLLGRAIGDRQAFLDMRRRLAAADFFLIRHQRIWTVLEQMLADGLDFDLATVQARASASGVDPGYVAGLAGVAGVNPDWHEARVTDLAVRRAARDGARWFQEAIADPAEPANELIGDLTARLSSQALGRASGAFREVSEQVDEAVGLLHERMRNPTAIHGLDLGSQFPSLSRTLQGLQPRRVVLVAATSGVGKSTLTLQMSAQLAVQQSVPVDFISLEMDTNEILFKMAAHLTGIDSQRISGGAVEGHDLHLVERAMQMLRKSPLRIYDADGLTPSEFVLYARESVMRRRTEVFVVDYVQLTGPDAHEAKLGRYDQLGSFSRTAKMKVARAMDVTVICCAQLQRDAATMERPTGENMGDSYQMVRDADVILLLHGNAESHTYDLWVEKNRQGRADVLVPVTFDAPTGTFHEAHGSPRVPDYRLQ